MATSRQALALFAQGLACWRGQVLAGIGAVLAQHPAAVALAQRRLSAVLAYADLAVEGGRPAEAVAVLQGIAEHEPLHEGLAARLMLALAGDGQQAAALRLFAEVRARLAEELGVAPGHEITSAHLRILHQDVSAGTPEPRAVPVVVPAQLPPDVADFTGRAVELVS